MTDVEVATRIQHNQERVGRGEQVYIHRKARKAASATTNTVASPSSTPTNPALTLTTPASTPTAPTVTLK
ncbi:hypothetical protein FA95DRAFT_1612760 [Auriscalpium vulgare]|uniref:Uncharacterized protein n=1 Tax=Auriscalpium vulgare TaxID=40419 RepID=A0ACB8R5I8_9AGAM|nr:hypothetical protein FA95DRAFT_1612760 [Auriscalpium vulgare]